VQGGRRLKGPRDKSGWLTSCTYALKVMTAQMSVSRTPEIWSTGTNSTPAEHRSNFWAVAVNYEAQTLRSTMRQMVPTIASLTLRSVYGTLGTSHYVPLRAECTCVPHHALEAGASLTKKSRSLDDVTAIL